MVDSSSKSLGSRSLNEFFTLIDYTPLTNDFAYCIFQIKQYYIGKPSIQ